jgi:hypothetical protein
MQANYDTDSRLRLRCIACSNGIFGAVVDSHPNQSSIIIWKSQCQPEREQQRSSKIFPESAISIISINRVTQCSIDLHSSIFDESESNSRLKIVIILTQLDRIERYDIVITDSSPSFTIDPTAEIETHCILGTSKFDGESCLHAVYQKDGSLVIRSEMLKRVSVIERGPSPDVKGPIAVAFGFCLQLLVVSAFESGHLTVSLSSLSFLAHKLITILCRDGMR